MAFIVWGEFLLQTCFCSSLPYCNSVIKETMRISAVAATAKQHAATEDTKFYGYTIPKVSSCPILNKATYFKIAIYRALFTMRIRNVAIK